MIMGILLLVAYVFMITQIIKRCHDRNNPGIYILIPFYSIYLLFAPSDKGKNDYGNSPNDPKPENEKNNEEVLNKNVEVDQDLNTEVMNDRPVDTPLGTTWGILGGSPGIVTEYSDDLEEEEQNLSDEEQSNPT